WLGAAIFCPTVVVCALFRVVARRLLFATALVLASCSSDQARQDQDISTLSGALTATQSRILDFEGTIGSSGDWTPVMGSGTTVASSNTHFSGAHSIALTGGQNRSAVSSALTTLGAIGPNATIAVLIPSSLQGQFSFGQISL